LSDKKEKLNVLKKEYEEYKKDIEVCPVCGKEMD
jgi:ssDNA-binding Zn-finger/Zn-ribbon topoisomerase 1